MWDVGCWMSRHIPHRTSHIRSPRTSTSSPPSSSSATPASRCGRDNRSHHAAAPIDKSVLLRGGYDYPGHTEMLASLTNSKVAMMLTSAESGYGKSDVGYGATSNIQHPTSGLRVVLAT